MTIGLVGQDQITTFTSPVNGTSPIDANVVRGNDNTVKTAFNVHDNDASVHLQSSLAASRPPAGVPHRKWLDSDTYRLYFDDGAAWHELAYLPAGGSPTFGDVHITGTLTVDGLTTLHDVHVTGALTVDGPVSAARLGVDRARRHHGRRVPARHQREPRAGAVAENCDATGGRVVGRAAMARPEPAPDSRQRRRAGRVVHRRQSVTQWLTHGGRSYYRRWAQRVGEWRVRWQRVGRRHHRERCTDWRARPASAYNATYGVVIRPKTGSLNDFTLVNTGFSAAVLNNPTGTVNLTTGGALTVAGGFTAQAGAIFNSDILGTATLVTLRRPNLVYIIMDGTGTTTANTQIQFTSSGVTQWQFGNNVNIGGNVLEFYSQIGGVSVLRLLPAGGMQVSGTATFNGDLTAVAGNVSLGPTTVFGAVSGTSNITAGGSIGCKGWLTVGASTASPVSLVNIPLRPPRRTRKDWVLMNNNGGFYINAYDEEIEYEHDGIQRHALGHDDHQRQLRDRQRDAVDDRLRWRRVHRAHHNGTRRGVWQKCRDSQWSQPTRARTPRTTGTVAHSSAIDASNNITVGGTGVRTRSFASARRPASVAPRRRASTHSGGLFVDTTNNRLCYWSGGARYYLAGNCLLTLEGIRCWCAVSNSRLQYLLGVDQ